MTWRLGIDIGGTFTDFALFDESGSEIAVLKRLTTPADPSIVVIEGTAALLRREDVPMAEVETIAHGTTLVTNAVIERRGAKTGMLVTAGFRDILDMGFEQRYDLFDLRLTWPDPLAPRRLRREVRERVGHDGQVIAALDLESTRAAVRDLVEVASVEAIAKRDAPRCARGPHRNRGARRAAGRTRSDPRRLGRARDRERGRGAGVSNPRVGTRVRLPEVVDGRVRRFRPRARARDRPQAPHPPRHLSHRGGRDVGARTAREPARLRGLAFAPGVPRRSRRRRRSKDSSRHLSRRLRGSSTGRALRTRTSAPGSTCAIRGRATRSK